MRPPFAMRRYRPEDRAACLAIFEGHVPEAFQVSERLEFARYLDDLPGPYWVVTGNDGEVVACGGVAVEPDATRGSLCWGMVHRDHQRRGIGTAFALERILMLTTTTPCRIVRLQTARATVPFFASIGFREMAAPAGEWVEMETPVTAETAPTMRRRLTAIGLIAHSPGTRNAPPG